jgi:branched-subunit amino acid aminotransferase/4-amino-4-deoxychorismate lyase
MHKTEAIDPMTPEPLAFLNGRLVPRAELTVACHDAGFVFAAATTDFARTYGRRLFRWPDHQARFRRDCAACRIPLPFADVELTAAAEQLIEANAQFLTAEDEFAVLTFATPGPLGHMAGLASGPAESGPPTVGMHTFRLAVERYAGFADSGVTLAVVGRHADPSVIPGGVKHRSRLHWYLAEKAVAEQHPGAVAVLVDGHGASADTAVGGVLAVAGGVVYLSPAGSVLDSISLQVAKEACAELGLGWEEAAFDFEGLCRPVEPVERGTFADRVTEVLLAGSGFGVAGVARCAAPLTRRDFPAPGPVCRQLQQRWVAMCPNTRHAAAEDGKGR